MSAADTGRYQPDACTLLTRPNVPCRHQRGPHDTRMLALQLRHQGSFEGGFPEPTTASAARPDRGRPGPPHAPAIPHRGHCLAHPSDGLSTVTGVRHGSCRQPSGPRYCASGRGFRACSHHGSDPEDRLVSRHGGLSVAELRGLPPTGDVETAALILGCGRTLAYELARRDEFPCRVLRLGRRYVVPTADLLRAVGLEPAVDDELDTTATSPPETGLRSASGRPR